MNSTVAALKRYCASNGIIAYAVGGYVRDLLLGRASKDLDVVVDGDPIAFGEGLNKHIRGHLLVLGQAHQIVRIVLPHDDTGGLGFIDISPLQGSIEDDLRRRDFTINALALPVKSLGEPDWKVNLVDPAGGAADINARRIRLISAEAVHADPVRLMRAVRFAASFGFSIEEETKRLVIDNASLIAKASPERVREELLATIALPRAAEHVRLMDSLGLLDLVLPELAQSKGCEQPKEHYWDVFNHSVEAVAASERVAYPAQDDPVYSLVPWSTETSAHFAEEVGDGHTRLTMLKLGALLHDIGKPPTKTMEPSGRMRFLGHHRVGADMARQCLTRMRFSSRGVDMVAGLVEHHMRPLQMTQGFSPASLPTNRAIYKYFRELGEIAVDVLYLYLADYLAARGPRLEVEDWANHVQLVKYILEVGSQQPGPAHPKRLVTGHDLLETFNLNPGPLVGRLLDAVLEAQAAGDVSTREEAIEWIRENMDRIKAEVTSGAA